MFNKLGTIALALSAFFYSNCASPPQPVESSLPLLEVPAVPPLPEPAPPSILINEEYAASEERVEPPKTLEIESTIQDLPLPRLTLVPEELPFDLHLAELQKPSIAALVLPSPPMPVIEEPVVAIPTAPSATVAPPAPTPPPPTTPLVPANEGRRVAPPERADRNIATATPPPPAARVEPQAAQPSPTTTAIPTLRKVEAQVGRTIRIALPGIGWIYLGEKDRRDQVRYLGRETSPDSTIFSFSVLEEGETVLQFQQQDLIAKTTRTDSVIVSTLERRIEQPPPIAAAEAQAEDPPRPKTAITPTEVEESFVQTVDRLSRQGKKRELVILLEEYLSLSQQEERKDLDQWYFRLAYLYETDPEVRNMKRALYYYEKIRDGYPFSSYWEEAYFRSRFIRRNFFEIR